MEYHFGWFDDDEVADPLALLLDEEALLLVETLVEPVLDEAALAPPLPLLLGLSTS